MKQKAIEHGYTVHGPSDDTEGFAYCIDGYYSPEFSTENEAWSAAVAEYLEVA